MTAAQMNLPYGMARMLMDGQVSVPQFTDAAINDPRALALVERITVEPDEAIDALGHDLRHTCEVRIQTTDGRTLVGDANRRKGSAQNPMTPREMSAKFDTLAGAALPADRVAAVRAAADGIEHASRAASLDELLQAEGGTR